MSAKERIGRVTPLERFDVLAGELDALKDRLAMMSREQSTDELLEVVNVADLANRHGVSTATMRKRLTEAGGTVFKFGKQHLIRKIKLLEVFERMEDGLDV